MYSLSRSRNYGYRRFSLLWKVEVDNHVRYFGHCTLSLAVYVQSMSSGPLNQRSNLILFSTIYPVFPNGLYPSDFLITFCMQYLFLRWVLHGLTIGYFFIWSHTSWRLQIMGFHIMQFSLNSLYAQKHFYPFCSQTGSIDILGVEVTLGCSIYVEQKSRA